MAAALDIQKEYSKLQRELNIIDSALSQIRAEKMWSDSERTKGTATLESLKSFEEATVSYKAVGRMFIRAPLPELKKELSEYVEERQKDSQACSSKEQVLEKQLFNAKHNLEEFQKSHGFGQTAKMMDKK